MRIQLSSLITKSSSSTLVASEFLSKTLHREIDASTLRRTYQQHFQELLELERDPVNVDVIDEVLSLFQKSFNAGGDQSILQVIEQTSSKDITFLVIQGTGKARFVDFGDAPQEWVKSGIAEPSIIEALALQQTPASTLLALAAGAECAPTKAWLDAGGSVLAVMRANPTRWLELIEYAKVSAGQLIIPMKSSVTSEASDQEIAAAAGIDLVADLEYIPQILSYSISQEHTVLGAYAYSPGSSHLIVQAAQDAIIEYASQHFLPNQIAFHWLATPTDSQLLPSEFLVYAQSRYRSRSSMVTIRDAIWQIFGQLRKPENTSTSDLVCIDSSVQKQGFNYQLAKRIQRLRAHSLLRKGFKVAYGVTPPATTESVLSHRILIASYRGAPRFGLYPFVKDLIGPISMHQCLHMLSTQFSSSHEMYSKFAVHGGLWRLAYASKSVWIPATITGLFGLLLPRNRAYRAVSLTKR